MGINRKIVTMSALAFLLCACGNDDGNVGATDSIAVVDDHSVDWVEGYSVTNQKIRLVAGGFDLAGQPAVSIHVGSDNKNLIDINLQRMHVKQGYTVRSNSANRPEMALRAAWEGVQYVQSTSHPTHVRLMIRSLTPDEAVIYVSGKLVDPATGNFMTISPSLVQIRGEKLQALLADN